MRFFVTMKNGHSILTYIHAYIVEKIFITPSVSS